jgi:hypothetical protein
MVPADIRGRRAVKESKTLKEQISMLLLLGLWSYCVNFVSIRGMNKMDFGVFFFRLKVFLESHEGICINALNWIHAAWFALELSANS